MFGHWVAYGLDGDVRQLALWIHFILIVSTGRPSMASTEDWQAFQFYYLINSTDVSKAQAPISYAIQICESAVPKTNCIYVAKSESYQMAKDDKAIDANLSLRVSRSDIENAMNRLKLTPKTALIVAETAGGFEGNFVAPISTLLVQGYGSQLLANRIESDKKTGRVHAMALICSKKTK